MITSIKNFQAYLRFISCHHQYTCLHGNKGAVTNCAHCTRIHYHTELQDLTLSGISEAKTSLSLYVLVAGNTFRDGWMNTQT
jgi:hypothetical protein